MTIYFRLVPKNGKIFARLKCLAIRIISAGFRVNTEIRVGYYSIYDFSLLTILLWAGLSRHFNPEVLGSISAKFSINVFFTILNPLFVSLFYRHPTSELYFSCPKYISEIYLSFQSLLHFQTKSESNENSTFISKFHR